MEDVSEHGFLMLCWNPACGLQPLAVALGRKREFRIGKRMLFRVVFLVCNNLFRGTKLALLHRAAIVNLSDPLENEPVVDT